MSASTGGATSQPTRSAVLELCAQRDGGVAVETHQQLDAGTGLHHSAGTGPRR
jgi:hypothetical protein